MAYVSKGTSSYLAARQPLHPSLITHTSVNPISASVHAENIPPFLHLRKSGHFLLAVLQFWVSTRFGISFQVKFAACDVPSARNGAAFLNLPSLAYVNDHDIATINDLFRLPGREKPNLLAS